MAGGANLKASYLETPMGRKLPAIREALVKAKVIWCDKSFILGEKCFTYGLLEPYCHRPKVWLNNESPRLSKAVQDLRDKARASLTLKVHRDLAERLSWLDFDHEAAVAYIKTLPLKPEQRSCFEVVADCLRDKNFQPSDCPYGRYHSALTRMPGCLRQFLSFQGGQLSFLDLKNSQPFILNCILSDYFKNNKKLEHFSSINFSASRRFHGFFENVLKEQSLSLPPPAPSLLSQESYKPNKAGDLMTKVKMPLDVQKYREITTNGTLYETLSKLGQCEDKERSKIKVELFEDYLYAKQHKGRMSSLFKEHFPSVDEVVRHFKSKNYKFLPKLMQKYESNLFINRIAKDYIAGYPDNAIGTVHDSLIVETYMVPQARALIEHHFNKIGLSPRLSREDYINPGQ